MDERVKAIYVGMIRKVLSGRYPLEEFCLIRFAGIDEYMFYRKDLSDPDVTLQEQINSW